MVKKRKKKDTGESLLSSTSSDCDYEESPALQDADAFAPFRVADYCRRYPEDAEAKYEFIVFVESTNEVPLGNRDMMSLSASFIRSVKGIQYLKKINKYKVGVVFQRANLANAFLDDATFLKEQRLKASIPAGATELAGVISSVPTHLSNHKIYKAISTTKKVISVRRIMRKVRQENNNFTLQPTQSVVITFASATSLPDYVHIKMWRLPVSAYVPPIKQCFKCLRYDHLAKFCKNSARCSICTEGHSFKECKVNIEKAKCINCNGNHIAISGQCPIRQKKIANSKPESYADTLKNPLNFPSLNKHLNSQEVIQAILSNSEAMTLLTESIKLGSSQAFNLIYVVIPLLGMTAVMTITA
ncbi:hypothetical protein KGM_203930 [Danaus plexippus plexippus]|uniref:Uncharacterized protein n=1 Tax=Danaus plexippus plexippus TaxID=278856 RepID=A0A212F9P6_DANPL|nr:hypothetical protein KGM_203930 [Danaus plexippus plexippus]